MQRSVVLGSLVIAMDDATRGKMSPEGEKAFERMWSIQLKDGADKGGWNWSDFDLDPWETKDSAYYGVALGGSGNRLGSGRTIRRVRRSGTMSLR